jgi:hypothetical protein
MISSFDAKKLSHWDLFTFLKNLNKRMNLYLIELDKKLDISIQRFIQ